MLSLQKENRIILSLMSEPTTTKQIWWPVIYLTIILTIKINNSRCPQILQSFFSQPTLCSDNGKADLTNQHLCNLLKELSISIVEKLEIRDYI